MAQRQPLIVTLSRTSIDRLGDRLRQGSVTDADLRVLDEYRRSFGEAYENVVQTIREGVHLEPTGRPAKSTASIVEKLNRESIRLVQIQDIAGCRVVVSDAVEQERVVVVLRTVFPGVSIVDRRARPSYGYRAVHAIVQGSGKAVEIQVRTSLQHLWAELSEKLSDVFDPAIKYGGGTDEVKHMLGVASEAVAGLEEVEIEIAGMKAKLAQLPNVEGRAELEGGLIDLQEKMTVARQIIRDALIESIPAAPEKKKEPKP